MKPKETLFAGALVVLGTIVSPAAAGVAAQSLPEALGQVDGEANAWYEDDAVTLC